MTNNADSVALLGLGAMGQRIARRLLDAGYALHIWNRTSSKADALVARGAARADTPAEAARAAEVVITMVSDPLALRAVTEGPDGIAAGAGRETALIDMSTVGPAAVARLSSIMRNRPLLDAPVLGSLDEAESGTLTIFIGGEDVTVERWTPMLKLLGKPIHVGGLGAGAAAKLVANSVLFTVIAGLGEALALADALGLERETGYRVLSTTPLAAQVERRRHAIEGDDYPPRFKLALAQKDAALIAEAAKAAGVDLRLAAAARSWLQGADRAGLGEQDYSAVLAEILRYTQTPAAGQSPTSV